jgi:hypothetical protein
MMQAGAVSLFDMAICGIPAVAFAIWQIVSVSHEIARDRQARPVVPERASPDGTGHPVGQHRLDDR